MTPFHHPLMDLPKFGDGTGLERVGWLMAALGLGAEDAGARSIVVTGSNGKGSTARIASELMAAAGGDVGLFTSPHLFRFNERFRINGAPVADAALSAAMDAVAEAVAAFQGENGDRVGAFEAQFVTALLLFQRAGVRWQVLEAGIGGRFDPVRVVRAPVVGLVSLDLEHTALLGETLIEIALDKLDAAPAGARVILGESCLPLRDEIAAAAQAGARRTTFVGPEDWRDHGVVHGLQRFDLLNTRLALDGLASPLIGRHQINNHAVAVRLCLERLRVSGIPLPADLSDRWREAVGQVRWPGRLERVRDEPAVYVDVGHTPEGVRAALAGYLSLHPAKATILVAGGSRDKDAAAMVEILAPAFDRIICTAAHHKGAAALDVAAAAQRAHPQAQVTTAPTIEDAARLATDEAARDGKAVYVAGGLFLAVEFTAVLNGADPLDLRFF